MDPDKYEDAQITIHVKKVLDFVRLTIGVGIVGAIIVAAVYKPAIYIAKNWSWDAFCSPFQFYAWVFNINWPLKTVTSMSEGGRLSGFHVLGVILGIGTYLFSVFILGCIIETVMKLFFSKNTAGNIAASFAIGTVIYSIIWFMITSS